MAADEAKVKIRLDNRQAKGDLRELTRSAGAAAGRVTGGFRASVARGFGAIGLGAGIGAGFAAARGAVSRQVSGGLISDTGDILSNVFGVVGTGISQWAYGDLAYTARANRRAGEDATQTFGAIAGELGKAPPGWKNYYESLKTLYTNEEKGRDIMRLQTGMANNKDIIDRIIDKITSKLGQEVKQGFLSLGIRFARWWASNGR